MVSMFQKNAKTKPKFQSCCHLWCFIRKIISTEQNNTEQEKTKQNFTGLDIIVLGDKKNILENKNGILVFLISVYRRQNVVS